MDIYRSEGDVFVIIREVIKTEDSIFTATVWRICNGNRKKYKSTIMKFGHWLGEISSLDITKNDKLVRINQDNCIALIRKIFPELPEGLKDGGRLVFDKSEIDQFMIAIGKK